MRQRKAESSRSLSRVLKRILIKPVHWILRDPTVREALWEIANRPSLSTGGNPRPLNPWFEVWANATRQTAEYIEEKMISVPFYKGRQILFEVALSRVTVDGLYLEFGCGWEAKSINFLAERIDGTIHGFDSFEGLPEPWFGQLTQGSLSTHGQLPKVRKNVQLHAGWFDQTLPEFIETHDGQVAFMHIDCDLYSSAKTVLDLLDAKITRGTVIQFDEYFNYPGWKNHEFKAFQEFIDKRNLTYDYLGYTEQFSVAVLIT